MDELVETPAWSMTTVETRGSVTELTRLATRVAELELRVAAHADRSDVGTESGAPSTASWWAHATRQTRLQAHRKSRLAGVLDSHDAVRTAMAEGRVLPTRPE